MEPIQVSLLSMVEAFGARNQEKLLGEVISPTWDIKSDVLASCRLIGADASVGIIGANAIGQFGVTVEADTYVTGIWLIEPGVTVAGTTEILDSYVQRIGPAGAPVQICPLRIDIPGSVSTIGRNAGFQRMFPLQGWPWGALLRGGDQITVRIYNSGGAATSASSLGYRGFSGPPP